MYKKLPGYSGNGIEAVLKSLPNLTMEQPMNYELVVRESPS